MNSPQRIYRASRALIKEFPVWYYFVSTVIATLLLLISSYDTGSTKLSFWGHLGLDRLNFDYQALLITIGGATSFGALIIGVNFISTEFKEENRGVRLLSLPISRAERILAFVFINWLYIPTISILPPFLLVALLGFFEGTTIHLPAIEYLIGVIPLCFLGIITFTSIWMFPSIAVPKRASILTVGIIILLGIYLSITRQEPMGSVLLAHEASAFLDTNVVGLNHLEVLDSEKLPSEYRFNISDSLGISGLSGLLSLALMLIAAGLGLNRKTA